MTTRRFDFRNELGLMLSGRLELPTGTPDAFAVFAHCFTCSKNIAAATRLTRALAARNIAVLRFDFTGLGNSEGDFANTNFSSNVEDLIAASRALAAEYREPELLVGHSLGGAAVLRAALRLDSVRAVATIGAPADPAHVRHLFGEDLETLEAGHDVEVELGGRRFRVRSDFVNDLREHSLSDLSRLERPLMVLHSPTDRIVGIEQARHIFETARHPKSFVSLDGADHLLSDPRDAEFAASVLQAWAGRYLTPAADVELPAPGHVVVRSTAERFQQEVRVGRHRWIADEPASVGGQDAGPTPYDQLLAALGSCISMTLGMYARHKGWPLEKVEVELAHDRIHARDCKECETEDGKIDRIRKTVRIQGEGLSDDQRERILQIADRCPVHRTLTSETRIDAF